MTPEVVASSGASFGGTSGTRGLPGDRARQWGSRFSRNLMGAVFVRGAHASKSAKRGAAGAGVVAIIEAEEARSSGAEARLDFGRLWRHEVELVPFPMIAHDSGTRGFVEI